MVCIFFSLYLFLVFSTYFCCHQVIKKEDKEEYDLVTTTDGEVRKKDMEKEKYGKKEEQTVQTWVI